jgi:hypothetical protein
VSSKGRESEGLSSFTAETSTSTDVVGAAQDGGIMNFPIHHSQPLGPRTLFTRHNHRQGLMAMEKIPLRIFLLNLRENIFFSWRQYRLHQLTIVFFSISTHEIWLGLWRWARPCIIYNKSAFLWGEQELPLTKERTTKWSAMELYWAPFLVCSPTRTTEQDGRAVCKAAKAIDIKKMEATIIRVKVPLAVLEQNKKERIYASKIHWGGRGWRTTVSSVEARMGSRCGGASPARSTTTDVSWGLGFLWIWYRCQEERKGLHQSSYDASYEVNFVLSSGWWQCHEHSWTSVSIVPGVTALGWRGGRCRWRWDWEMTIMVAAIP